MAHEIPIDLKKKFEAEQAPVTDYVHPQTLNVGPPTIPIVPPAIRGEYVVDKAILEGFPSLFIRYLSRGA